MSSVEPAGDDRTKLLYGLSKEELVKIIVDDAKNWLARRPRLVPGGSSGETA